MAFSTRGMIPCHPQGLPVDGYVRYNVLYLTRTARAHLQLGDLDAAAEASTQTPPSTPHGPPTPLVISTLSLGAHWRVRAVQDFLLLTL